jgi:hypothetical protein
LIPFSETKTDKFEPAATILFPFAATAKRLVVAPTERSVQVVPSGEVTITPELPTATNCEPVHVMPHKLEAVLLVRLVQVTPSAELMMPPLAPTATNVDPDHASFSIVMEVGFVAADHDVAFVDVKMQLDAATITRRVPVHMTEFNEVDVGKPLVVTRCQVMPSLEVMTVLDKPTATNMLPVHVTDFSQARVGESTMRHAAPSVEVSNSPPAPVATNKPPP